MALTTPELREALSEEIALRLLRAQPYVYVKQFGVTGKPGSDNEHLNYPEKCSLDNKGNIWVADYDNHRVIKLNLELEFVTQIGETLVPGTDSYHFDHPRDVKVSEDGHVFVADGDNHRVIEYDENLVFVGQFGETKVAKADNTHLHMPMSVDVDKDGYIYVADRDNHRVVKLNPDLTYSTQFGVTGVQGADMAHLHGPGDAVVDRRTRCIYVVDIFNERIVKLSSTLAWVKQYGLTDVMGYDERTLCRPWALDVDVYGNMYIAGGNQHCAIKLDREMNFVDRLGFSGIWGKDERHFHYPSGVAVYPDGNLIVSDSNNHRLVLFYTTRFVNVFEVPPYFEDVLFYNEEIRDTTTHNSGVSLCKGYTRKTIIIQNGLDQAVEIQPQADRDETFPRPFNVGAPITVAARPGAVDTYTVDYITITDNLPRIRVTAVCSVAPTSGALHVFLEKQR